MKKIISFSAWGLAILLTGCSATAKQTDLAQGLCVGQVRLNF